VHGAPLKRVRKQPTWTAIKNLNLKLQEQFSLESSAFRLL
jgi:hypothetical protein